MDSQIANQMLDCFKTDVKRTQKTWFIPITTQIDYNQWYFLSSKISWLDVGNDPNDPFRLFKRKYTTLILLLIA